MSFLHPAREENMHGRRGASCLTSMRPNIVFPSRKRGNPSFMGAGHAEPFASKSWGCFLQSYSSELRIVERIALRSRLLDGNHRSVVGLAAEQPQSYSKHLFYLLYITTSSDGKQSLGHAARRSSGDQYGVPRCFVILKGL